MTWPAIRRKYGNKVVRAEGMTFDSVAEYNRWKELRLAQEAGRIENLRHHTVFELDIPSDSGVEDQHICDYEADFTYFDTANGALVVEDVKGFRTDVYRLKKKLMLALRDIEIKEIRPRYDRPAKKKRARKKRAR